jgi:nucleotide-binding universal stress UspA family protein
LWRQSNVLFATDFGREAERAAQYAFSLAQEHGARLTVLHVVEEVRMYTEEQIEQVRKANIQKMRQFMPPNSNIWCKINSRANFGTAEEIPSEAGERKANVIIMGAKTRKSFDWHAPMTIAYNVGAKAEWPVFTVRG